MSTMPRHSVSVTAIAVDEADRALIVQRRDNGRWEPPGGVLELDETIEAGAQREAFEETGVKMALVGLTGIYKNMNLGVVALVYRARAVSGEPRTGPETQATRWVSRDEAATLMPEVYAVRVLDALDVPPGSPQIRYHDGVRLLPGPGTVAE